jgi:hypothetical protein
MDQREKGIIAARRLLSRNVAAKKSLFDHIPPLRQADVVVARPRLSRSKAKKLTDALLRNLEDDIWSDFDHQVHKNNIETQRDVEKELRILHEYLPMSHNAAANLFRLRNDIRKRLDLPELAPPDAPQEPPTRKRKKTAAPPVERKNVAPKHNALGPFAVIAASSSARQEPKRRHIASGSRSLFDYIPLEEQEDFHFVLKMVLLQQKGEVVRHRLMVDIVSNMWKELNKYLNPAAPAARKKRLPKERLKAVQARGAEVHKQFLDNLDVMQKHLPMDYYAALFLFDTRNLMRSRLKIKRLPSSQKPKKEDFNSKSAAHNAPYEDFVDTFVRSLKRAQYGGVLELGDLKSLFKEMELIINDILDEHSGDLIVATPQEEAEKVEYAESAFRQFLHELDRMQRYMRMDYETAALLFKKRQRLRRALGLPPLPESQRPKKSNFKPLGRVARKAPYRLGL